MHRTTRCHISLPSVRSGSLIRCRKMPTRTSIQGIAGSSRLPIRWSSGTSASPGWVWCESGCKHVHRSRSWTSAASMGGPSLTYAKRQRPWVTVSTWTRKSSSTPPKPQNLSVWTSSGFSAWRRTWIWGWASMPSSLWSCWSTCSIRPRSSGWRRSTYLLGVASISPHQGHRCRTSTTRRRHESTFASSPVTSCWLCLRVGSSNSTRRSSRPNTRSRSYVTAARGRPSWSTP